MADTAVKVGLGVQDAQFHDPAVSTVQQTFSRVGEGGATISGVKKIGSNSVPILDPVWATGARGGFYELHNGAPTQTNANVEAALRLLRSTYKRVVNFEGRGGIPNDSSDAAGEANRRVWDDIMTEFQTRPGTVYFPKVSDGWYFKRHASDAGNDILPFWRYATAGDRTPANCGILGDGVESVIKGCPGAPATDHLLTMSGRGISIDSIKIDRNVLTGSSNGHAVRFEEVLNQPIQYVRIFNAWFAKGGLNLSLDNPSLSTPQVNSNWVIGELTLENAWNQNAIITNLSGLQMSRLRWFARNSGSGGFGIYAARNGDACSDVTADSIIGYTGGDLFLSVSSLVTFNSSLHGRHKVAKVRVPGYVGIDNVPETDLINCTPFGILANFNLNGIAFGKVRFIDCDARAGLGLVLNVTEGATLTDWLIRGGSYETNIGSGIDIVAGGAVLPGTIRKGRVQGAYIGENGTGGASPGMYIRTTGAAGGTNKGTIVEGCHFCDLKGVPTQQYGIQEIQVGAGQVDWNLYANNIFQGNTIAPWLVIGANSVVGLNQYM